MAVHTETIQKLYVAYFNRPADYEGLAHWEKVLNQTNGNRDLVTSAFAQSPEFKALTAGQTQEQIINQIYKNLFNRDADPGGMAFWSARLREGTFSVDQIFKVIADSASNTDKTTYANKVTAATALTAEFDTAIEVLAYTNAKAVKVAKDWLSGISDQASLDRALDPQNLDKTVSDIVDAAVIVDGVQIHMDGSAAPLPPTQSIEVITLEDSAGASALSVDLGATPGVGHVDASKASVSVTVDLSAHAGGPVRVLGGAGADALSASMGTNASADVLEGGAGDDVLVAGSNGAQLSGGLGKDQFVLAPTATGFGSKDASAYSTVKDFSADDVLQLKSLNGATVGAVTAFAKLGANLNESTAVFSDFVKAAVSQAHAGEAVWFAFQNNAYVVVDSGAESADAFVAGQDLIIELTGVNLDNASFNGTHGTVALA